MLADDGQALVERRCRRPGRRGRCPRSAGTGRRGGRRPGGGAPCPPGGSAKRLFEACRVPAGGAPLFCFLPVAGRSADELLVAHLPAEFTASAIRLVVAVDGRERLARVLLGDVGDVAAEDGGVERLRVGQVIRHEQELAAGEPLVVLGDDVGEAFLAAGVGVALKDGVQHRHEVRLTGAEGAVEVGGAGRAGLQGGLDQVEGLVEVGGERLGDHIVGDRGLVLNPLSQGEHEVTVMDRVGDRDEVPQQHLVAHAALHASALISTPALRWPYRASSRHLMAVDRVRARFGPQRPALYQRSAICIFRFLRDVHTEETNARFPHEQDYLAVATGTGEGPDAGYRLGDQREATLRVNEPHLIG